MIDNDLLEILICPLTNDPLRLEGDKLVNEKWGVKYPIRYGIPVLLIDQAELPEGIGSIGELKDKIASEGR